MLVNDFNGNSTKIFLLKDEVINDFNVEEHFVLWQRV